ncbi:MAG: hypothetical protein IPM91_13320 [Bacteroidetes bacterium]|nr:hypothetical protein [Bacteroidota bacterium]
MFHRDTLPLGIFIIEKGKVKIYKYAGNGEIKLCDLLNRETLLATAHY